jgi:hypothetical protein
VHVLLVQDLQVEGLVKKREFISNEDIDVRRCILPGLSLRSKHYPAELHALVTEAIRIGRAHPDEYIRHRVEIRVHP